MLDLFVFDGQEVGHLADHVLKGFKAYVAGLGFLGVGLPVKGIICVTDFNWCAAVDCKTGVSCILSVFLE